MADVDLSEQRDLTDPDSYGEVSPGDGEEAGAGFARHVELRTIVIPELRLVFLPIPKAGCTSVLWLLADLLEIPRDLFAGSTLAEVSPSLTVHDMSLWGEGRRLADYEGEERERILGEDGWLRFTITRHPGKRLWSAWQSKLLLREPRFVQQFGDEPWFPRLPEGPGDIVDDFRRFVGALPSSGILDVHWAVQDDLASQLPLDHVGRVEELDQTLELLRQHLGRELPIQPRRENRTALPLPAAAFTEGTNAIVEDVYRADFERFGYDPDTAAMEALDDEEWRSAAAPLLSVLRDTVDRNERIGQLHDVARRVQTLERQLENRAIRRVGHSRAPILTNLENHTQFNVQWGWSEGETTPGFTAVVRAKNEAEVLPWALPPLLDAVERVVLVDNGSTDHTVDVARSVAAENGAAERLEVHSYPFSVARCGEEHLGTPAESVHSLVYFYNWSFSHVRTGYALKWDADMVLSDSGVRVLRDLAWQLEADEMIVKIPRYPLYVVDDRRAFLDVGMSNCEPWAWPNRPGYSFVKAMEWEQPIWPEALPTLVLPDWSCVELKHLDADEFSHWSHTDFGASARTQRKRREWEVFNSLANGDEPPPDVITVEAPNAVHVIEHVRSTLLPEMARRPSGFGERLIRQLTA
jgi:hypothetical protein